MLLIKAGERVALMGTDAAQPRGGRAQLNRMALALGTERRATARPDYGAPPADRLAHGGRAVFFSDFLGDLDALEPALAHAADQGVRGCFVQVLDESEEVFPFDGRMIFESMGGTHRVRDPARPGAARGLRASGWRSGGRELVDYARHLGWRCLLPPHQRSRRARRCSGSTWRSASGRDAA